MPPRGASFQRYTSIAHMKLRSVKFFLAALAVLALAAPVGRAQSLGEAAQQEREKRARKRPPTHVYGNQDLPGRGDSAGGGSPGSDGTEAPDPAASGSQRAVEPGAADAAEGTAPTDRKLTEAEWRFRAAPIRSDLEDAEKRVTQLESEIEQLERQRLALLPLQDLQTTQALDEARRNLEASREARKAARKAWDDLEEDARRAGAYPGWLR